MTRDEAEKVLLKLARPLTKRALNVGWLIGYFMGWLSGGLVMFLTQRIV